MLEIKKLTIKVQQKIMVDNLSLCVAPGEIITLMGPSGSGKSTLLNWVIGDLDSYFQAQGSLWVNGIRRDQSPIEERHIGILFQDDLLFPNMNVGQNLAFALPESVRGREQRRHRVEAGLAQIGLAGFYSRDPWTLSGGQRAHVSMMRTLLAQPDALLLDEPFSSLDVELRVRFREFVFEQVRQFQVPTLLVSHDPSDVPPGGKVIEFTRWSDYA